MCSLNRRASECLFITRNFPESRMFIRDFQRVFHLLKILKRVFIHSKSSEGLLYIYIFRWPSMLERLKEFLHSPNGIFLKRSSGVFVFIGDLQKVFHRILLEDLLFIGDLQQILFSQNTSRRSSLNKKLSKLYIYMRPSEAYISMGHLPKIIFSMGDLQKVCHP